MNGYGSHTFKTINAAGEAVYVKWHFKTDQGKGFVFYFYLVLYAIFSLQT